ncbi:hypothetical protein ACHAWC_009920, partial [Mediolabrus comicus]
QEVMKSEEDDHHTVATASDDEDDFLHMNERRPSDKEEVSSHSASLEIDDKEAVSVGAAAAIKTDDVIDDTVVQPVSKVSATTAAPRRSSLRPETDSSYYDRPKTDRSKLQLQFGSVNIREYEMILGDNPSVTYGPPVTLDWVPVAESTLPVDEYECQHYHPRKCYNDMYMNYYQRHHLCALAGYTPADIEITNKEVNKCKTNRFLTRHFSSYPAVQLETALESALRKARRVLKDDHWKSEKHLFADV